ncbi:hypothetical protein B0H13DRAFT_1936324 [Mycena leptocephala]|nr:hypothetical protein B0H13DRAFT_1936324 [Mycena leptocephala]
MSTARMRLAGAPFFFLLLRLRSTTTFVFLVSHHRSYAILLRMTTAHHRLLMCAENAYFPGAEEDFSIVVHKKLDPPIMVSVGHHFCGLRGELKSSVFSSQLDSVIIHGMTSASIFSLPIHRRIMTPELLLKITDSSISNVRRTGYLL